MNIHLIEKQKFTDKFIELIDYNYPDSSNIVYEYETGAGFECKKASCAKSITRLSDIDFSLLGEDDKFFVHAFYTTKTIRFIYRNIHRFKKYQLVLICWGADIYDARFALENHKFDFKLRFHEYLKRRIIKCCDIFMTFACADYEIITKYYGGHGKQFDCLYPSNANLELLDKLKNDYELEIGNSFRNNTFKILLGNSATKTNLHIQALDAMAKFSDEDIEIICPLSYGDKEYGKKVVDYGKSVFKEKFKPILDYMSTDDYSRLLNSVDVAVFNHNRQQGTGNIEILAYLGKKLYIRSDTTTWKHYVIRDGCKFFDAKLIEKMSFNDFISMKKDDVSINEEYFRKIWDINYVKSLWDKVMEYRG
ncbi:4-alpha-L-fucosyltransferase glycosyl transferase group 56 [Lachnospiraceae bacterium]|nr:4-alpha-L-fucosyltransferase glycosyl transferase group 56 [Lachnospiraceae bacterium]